MLENYYDCVGKGWKPILEALNDYFKYVINSSKDIILTKKIVNEINDEVPEIIISQVKEKFGGLRVYVDFKNIKDEYVNEINGAINLAGRLAYKICEDCGSMKQVTTTALKGRGWIRTLCSDCRNKI